MVFKEAMMSGVDNFSISLVIALYMLNNIRILVLTHNLLTTLYYLSYETNRFHIAVALDSKR